MTFKTQIALSFTLMFSTIPLTEAKAGLRVHPAGCSLSLSDKIGDFGRISTSGSGNKNFDRRCAGINARIFERLSTFRCPCSFSTIKSRLTPIFTTAISRIKSAWRASILNCTRIEELCSLEHH